MVAPESPTARKQRHEGRPPTGGPLDERSTLGTVPPDNRLGHSPDHDQDRPPLDLFAERLGLRRRSGDDATDERGGRAGSGEDVARAVRRLGDRGAGVVRASRRVVAAGLERLSQRVDPGPADAAPDPVAERTDVGSSDERRST